MISLTFVIISFAVFFGFAYTMQFMETKKSISLNKIRDNFSVVLESDNQKYKSEMVYIWLENEKKNYFNGMLTSSNQDGLFIKGGILFFWVKEIFIPWSELEASGKIWCFLSRKNKYYISSLNVYVAVLQEYS
ncbi:hypothetical protein ACM9HF_02265 [Colwellia sp. RE-S-Sl-9]